MKSIDFENFIFSSPITNTIYKVFVEGESINTSFLSENKAIIEAMEFAKKYKDKRVTVKKIDTDQKDTILDVVTIATFNLSNQE